MFRCICLILAIFRCTGQQQIPDECNHYIEIPEVHRRGKNYVPSTDEPQVNDYYLDEGWYGKDGYDILTEDPKSATACGAMSPIYFKGTMPENIGDTVLGSACVVGWFSDCMKKIQVEIKRCSDTLNIYYLRASTIVFSAYCFGRSDRGGEIAPAPDYQPDSVEVEVDIDWNPPEPTRLPGITLQKPQLVFKCLFHPVREDLVYQVNWFVGDKFIVSKVAVNRENFDQLTMREDQLRTKGITKLGFVIKCGVRALADLNGIPGNAVSSTGFFAGIKVKTPKVVLQRGEETTVSFVSSLPYGCNHINGRPGYVDTCPAFIETYYTEGTSCSSNVAVKDAQGRRKRSAHRCGVQMKETKFNDMQNGGKKNWTQEFKWTISQIDDGHYTLTETHFKVKLRVSQGDYHYIWHGYELDDIHVQVEDKTSSWKKKTCSAYCDPHMKTFDGTTYEMQKSGIYTLYKHKKLPIEVQLESGKCVSGVTNAHCPCGVYIRGGTDIYVVSTCPKHRFINYLHCGDGSLQVYREGDRKYKVFLPTGAMVTVSLTYGHHLNVVINAAPRDENNVEGLCGDLNGRKDDDFIVNGNNYGAITKCGWFECRNSFIDLYLLSPDKWFFPIRKENRKLIPEMKTASITDIVCLCPVDVESNSEVGKSECSSKAFSKCSSTKQKQQSCSVKNARKKRNVVDELEKLQFHSNRLSQALERSKRSLAVQTITEEQARTICQAKFSKAGSFEYCQSNVPGIQNTKEVENCIFDLNVTGVTKWAEDALDAVTHQCIHEAEKNTTLQNSTNTEGGQSIADVIKEITCPNECSDNGYCVNGTCQCEGDFGGSDCSFEVKKPPVIHLDVGDDICDTADDPCENIHIYGEDFIDSENLTCKIEVHQIGINGMTLNPSSIVKVRGEAISPFEVKCQTAGFRRRRDTQTNAIIFFERFVISIANDGTLFGIQKEISVIDSRCQIASAVENVFTLKDGYCFIDGTCVQSGDHMEGDRREVCLPINDTFHWTRIENVPPVVTEPCLIYKPLPHMSHRGATTLSSALEETLNDFDLVEGWYGMDGYDILLTALTQSEACGAMSGIWLQGELPTSINETTFGSACVTGWIEGCVADILVEIKNCSITLNVYYLKPSEVMYSAYCFESSTVEKQAVDTTAVPIARKSTTDMIVEDEESSTVEKQAVNTTAVPIARKSTTDMIIEVEDGTTNAWQTTKTINEANTIESTKDSDDDQRGNNAAIIGVIVAAVVVVLGLVVFVVILFVRKAKRYSFVPEKDLHVHTECDEDKEDNAL